MPRVSIPPSRATVSVSIIDTTSWAYNIPCAALFEPKFGGLDTFDICCYSFLVTHTDPQSRKTRKILFDLGIRKQWQDFVPPLVEQLRGWIRESGTRIEVEKEVADILTEHGTDPGSIEAIVWSHLHFDHVGNPSTFPRSVKLAVGPGVKERHMPGWPANLESWFMETDVEGREVVELSDKDFAQDIGGMAAYDYFGDGSFYLLSAPGHSVGHLNALARVSNDPESFIFMAADSVHLAGELRPSVPVPLPEHVDVPGIKPRPCPGEILLEMHPCGASSTVPFLGLSARFPEEGLAEAEQVIEKVQHFDGDERVLVVFAHDVTLHDSLEYFPKAADDWLSKGWKEAGRWRFLADLQKIYAAQKGRQPVD